MNKKIVAGMLCMAALAACITGCGKANPTETSMSQMIVNTEGLNLAELSNNLFVTTDTGVVPGYAIKTRQIYVEPGEAVTDLTLTDIGENVESLHLGDKTYTVAELIADGNDGDAILRRLNQDFGIKKYDIDMNYVSTPGVVSEEALYTEDAYSFTITNNGRTGRVYFFDVHLSSLSSDVQEQCRAAWNENYGSNDCINLDGKVSLIVYETSEGDPAGYEISVQAPVYYDTYDNFAANMDVAVRYDITNCHIRMTDGMCIGCGNDATIIR